MIQSIEIENFRGIQKGKLEGLTPLTILVGPNGCGKSAVLDSMFIAANQDPESALRTVAGSRVLLPAGGARWILWKKEKQTRSVLVPTFQNGTQRIIVIGAPEIKSSAIPPRWQNTLALIHDTNRTTTKMVVSQPGISLDLLIAGVSIHSGDVRLVDMSNQMSHTSLVDLFTEAVSEGRRDHVTSLVQAVVPGVVRLEILTESGTPVLHLESLNGSIPATISGDGIHMLLRLCLELTSRNQGVVLVEEPEVHQHPGSLRQSARAILAAVRRDIQVVLTTHNLEFIDFLISETESSTELENLSVVRLKLDDGCLKSSTISGPDAEFSRSHIENDLR